MELDITTVDSFSNKPFGGNPAAVCVVPDGIVLSDSEMQLIAAEMNLSETAFLSCRSSATLQSGEEFNLRWFTPTCEVPLCGHGTLAAAAVLFKCHSNSNKELVFHTLSEELSAVLNDDFVGINLPLAVDVCSTNREGIEELLLLSVGGLPVQEVQYSSCTKKLLVRLNDNITMEQLTSIHPDTTAMLASHSGKVRGVIITVRGKETYDFVSRYFAPWNGIPEDPVTGSAHTVLAAYWGRELKKDEMFARQCSKRGGELKIKVCAGDRVHISGQASIVMTGKIYPRGK